MKQLNKGHERIYSGRYWKHVFFRTAMYVGVFALIVTVIGVLSIPVIMSLVYSWGWMFLYLVYLVTTLLILGYSGV